MRLDEKYYNRILKSLDEVENELNLGLVEPFIWTGTAALPDFFPSFKRPDSTFLKYLLQGFVSGLSAIGDIISSPGEFIISVKLFMVHGNCFLAMNTRTMNKKQQAMKEVMTRTWYQTSEVHQLQNAGNSGIAIASEVVLPQNFLNI